MNKFELDNSHHFAFSLKWDYTCDCEVACLDIWCLFYSVFKPSLNEELLNPINSIFFFVSHVNNFKTSGKCNCRIGHGRIRISRDGGGESLKSNGLEMSSVNLLVGWVTVCLCFNHFLKYVD